MSKKLRFLFVTSLLLNALLIGVLIGRGMHYFSPPPPPPPMMDEAKLAPEMKEKLSAMWQELRDKNKPMFDQMRDARQEAVRLLTAEPFDEAAYNAQARKLEELKLTASRNMSESVKNLMRSLPQDQREQMAEFLKRPPHMRWGHHRPPPRGMGGDTPPSSSPGAEGDMPSPPPSQD